MSAEGLMRIETVVSFVELSKSSIYQEIRENRFPRPRKVRGCSRWIAEEVKAYVKEKELGK